MPLCTTPHPTIPLSSIQDAEHMDWPSQSHCVLTVFFFFRQEVINVCKKHLPNMAKGYSSPKLTQYIGDGFEYMRQHENEFDVVITDSSDPVGMYHHCHRSSRHPPIWE